MIQSTKNENIIKFKSMLFLEIHIFDRSIFNCLSLFHWLFCFQCQSQVLAEIFHIKLFVRIGTKNL